MHRFNVLIESFKEVGSFGLFSPGIVEGGSHTVCIAFMGSKLYTPSVSMQIAS
jgi:hypothetical protein